MHWPIFSENGYKYDVVLQVMAYFDIFHYIEERNFRF